MTFNHRRTNRQTDNRQTDRFVDGGFVVVVRLQILLDLLLGAANRTAENLVEHARRLRLEEARRSVGHVEAADQHAENYGGHSRIFENVKKIVD